MKQIEGMGDLVTRVGVKYYLIFGKVLLDYKKFLVLIILLINSLFNSAFLFSQEEGRMKYEYALIEAGRQKNIGNINEAIKLYKACIKINSELDIAFFELGNIYLLRENLELAVKNYRNAYQLNQLNEFYAKAYFQALFLNKQYDLMIKLIKRRRKIEEDVDDMFLLASAYTEIGKHRKALGILGEIEKQYGISEKVVLKRINILENKRDLEKAEKEINKLISLYPESSTFYVFAGEFFKDVGYIEKSVDYYHMAYQIDSSDVYVISALADYYIEQDDFSKGLFYLSRAFKLDKIPLQRKINSLLLVFKDSVIQSFKSEVEGLILELLKHDKENFRINAIAYDYYTKINKPEISYHYIQKLVSMKKDNYQIWIQAIYIADYLNEYEDMVDYCSEVISIFPNKREIKKYKSIALFQLKRYDEAYTILNDLYKTNEDPAERIELLSLLAENSFSMGEKNIAFNYFEELLVLDSVNYLAMNNYSYYLAISDKNLSRAEELSSITLKAFPENDIYIDTYAWILYKQGKFKKALDVISKISLESVNDEDIIFHLINIYKKNDLNEKAVYFEKILNEIKMKSDDN